MIAWCRGYPEAVPSNVLCSNQSLGTLLEIFHMLISHSIFGLRRSSSSSVLLNLKKTFS